MGVRNKDEFVGLIKKHYGIIYKICNIYGGNYREDLQQEIVYQLWKSYPSFKGRSKFQTWMYRVALNTALFEAKKVNREYTELKNFENTNGESPEELTEKINRIEQLYFNISKLNDVDKAITLLYLEKCSYKEIAEITGMTEKNVGIRLFRIKNKLKQMFNQQEAKP